MPNAPELHTWKDGKMYKLIPDGHQGEEAEEDVLWGEQQYILEEVNEGEPFTHECPEPGCVFEVSGPFTSVMHFITEHKNRTGHGGR